MSGLGAPARTATRVLESDPLSALALSLLGVLYWDNRQFELSIQHCTRALALDDVNAIALWFLGLNRAALGDESESVACLSDLHRWSTALPERWAAMPGR